MPIEITRSNADRLLGLSDEYLDDWRQTSKSQDPEYVERQAEYDQFRPVFMAAPALLSALQVAYPGLTLESKNTFALVRTKKTGGFWKGIAVQTSDTSWSLSHSGSDITAARDNLLDSLRWLSDEFQQTKFETTSASSANVSLEFEST